MMILRSSFVKNYLSKLTAWENKNVELKPIGLNFSYEISNLDRIGFFLPGFIGNVPVMLAKPQTFMNVSGESVSMIIWKTFNSGYFLWFFYCLITCGPLLEGWSYCFLLQDSVEASPRGKALTILPCALQ